MTVTLIQAQHIEAAMGRWRDFWRVQIPEPSEAEVTALTQRMEAGESAYGVLREQAQAPAREVAPALRRLKAGLGLSRRAQRAFYEGVDDNQDDQAADGLTPEEIRDQAAMLGLIVGLTAQQLASEEEG